LSSASVSEDARFAAAPWYNIAPTQDHFVLISEYERRKVLPALWGVVIRAAKDNSRAAQCINAMAETIEVEPSFREAFRQRRCIVPADGFYDGADPTKRGRRFGFALETADCFSSRALRGREPMRRATGNRLHDPNLRSEPGDSACFTAGYL
jgi:putative SOS response-associated peptidase YedK